MTTNIIKAQLEKTKSYYINYIKNNPEESNRIRETRNEYIRNLSKNEIKSELGDSISEDRGLGAFFIGSLFRKYFAEKRVEGMYIEQFNKELNKQLKSEDLEIDISENDSSETKGKVEKSKSFIKDSALLFASVFTLISLSIGVTLIATLNIPSIFALAFLGGGFVLGGLVGTGAALQTKLEASKNISSLTAQVENIISTNSSALKDDQIEKKNEELQKNVEKNSESIESLTKNSSTLNRNLKLLNQNMQFLKGGLDELEAEKKSSKSKRGK